MYTALEISYKHMRRGDGSLIQYYTQYYIQGSGPGLGMETHPAFEAIRRLDESSGGVASETPQLVQATD